MTCGFYILLLFFLTTGVKVCGKKGAGKVRVEFTMRTDLLKSGRGFHLAPLCGERNTK